MEIVTTLPSDKSLGYFRMSLTGHQSLPTGSRNLPQNLSLTLRHWHSRCNSMGERSRSVELPSEKSTGRFAVGVDVYRTAATD